jgi:septum formation topological specificity factor MinE
MRRFEIVDKDVTTVKLTIAKERTTLKIPPSIEPELRERLTAFAKYVDSQFEEIEFTLRGRMYLSRDNSTNWKILLSTKGPDGKDSVDGKLFTTGDIACKGLTFYTGSA